MLHNHWGITKYPFIPGHEMIGVVEATGAQVKLLKPGQRVGMGGALDHARHVKCASTGISSYMRIKYSDCTRTYGGFADRVRAQAEWVFPLPENLDFNGRSFDVWRNNSFESNA